MCQAVIEWEAEARGIGRNLKLIELVQRKLQKGKTQEIIVDELEESLENVERICETVNKCGLEADAMVIYETMQNMVAAQ